MKRALLLALVFGRGNQRPRRVRRPVNRQPGRPVIGTAPVLYARTWDFGDTVVAVMLQPTWGGKAYWSGRAHDDRSAAVETKKHELMFTPTPARRQPPNLGFAAV